MSQTATDTAIVTMEGEEETTPKLSNGTSFNDIEWPLSPIARSRYYSTSNNWTTTRSCMICPMVPFPVILSDPLPRFQGHGVTRDLFAIAKFLLCNVTRSVAAGFGRQGMPLPPLMTQVQHFVSRIKKRRDETYKRLRLWPWPLTLKVMALAADAGLRPPSAQQLWSF